MFVVALTGGFASGKTSASSYFAKLGVPVLDADLIARELTLSGTDDFNEIVSHFGTDFVQPDGQLARFKLREYIFQHPEQKVWLENKLHPKIFERIQTGLKSISEPYCIVVIPLLAETISKYEPVIDRICVIDLPLNQQVQRAYQREAISPELAEKIIQSQASREKRLKLADDILENQGSPETLEQAVQKLHQQYLKLAAS
ncbi:MAG: dephospho-CoA kinase [Gammaproteobacteria bacterium]